MADTPVQASNGRHNLGGTRHAALEDVDPNTYDVFLTDKNLAAAKKAYADYDWFICFSVKAKKGGAYANMDYTLTLDAPATGTKLYYYYNNKANPLSYADAGNGRVKATVPVGDPPVGAR
jgi:hypothetical protein